jgi:hypothetical protein
MGHRKYLAMDHLFRQNKRPFNGNQELGCAPDVLNGDEILKQLEGMMFGDESVGKARMDIEKEIKESEEEYSYKATRIDR